VCLECATPPATYAFERATGGSFLDFLGCCFGFGVVVCCFFGGAVFVEVVAVKLLKFDKSGTFFTPRAVLGAWLGING
jgi:hypothetical protein